MSPTLDETVAPPTRLRLPSGAIIQLKGEAASYDAAAAGRPKTRHEFRHVWPLAGQKVELVILLDGIEAGRLGPWLAQALPRRAAVAQAHLVVSADADPVEANG